MGLKRDKILSPQTTATAVFGNLEPCKYQDKRSGHASFLCLENKGLNLYGHRCRIQPSTYANSRCLSLPGFKGMAPTPCTTCGSLCFVVMIVCSSRPKNRNLLPG